MSQIYTCKGVYFTLALSIIMNRTLSELRPVIASGILLLSWIVGLWQEFIPYDNWALYVYSGLIVITYFSILWSVSNHLSPMQQGSEAVAVILFLVATLLLVTAFGFGWEVFGNFSDTAHSRPTKVDSFYFSVVAFTTLGFGDFAPSTNAGKIFLSIEALMGVTHTAAFFSIVISRFVSRAS